MNGRDNDLTRPSGAMHWVVVAFGIIAVMLMVGLYLAFAYYQSSSMAPDVVEEPVIPMPDAAERRVLVAVTHKPHGAVMSEGQAAMAGNARLAFSDAPITPASPFSATRAAQSARLKAELCLTQAIYYEAGFEPLAGKRAVAQTVLNRVRHPAFPHSICGVVYEGARQPVCQFSFTCDGALARKPAAVAWAEARAVARDALAGYVEKSVGLATHYHANYVLPYWAPELAKVARIGTHIFYRWPGGWGMPRAFSERYAGVEAVPLFDGIAAGQGGPPINYPPVAALPERRAENDLGGRVDISKGWTPNIPAPAQSSTALAQIYAAQSTIGIPQ